MGCAQSTAVAQNLDLPPLDKPAPSTSGGGGVGGEVIIYGTENCGWCSFVKEDFASAGIAFRFANTDDDANNTEMWAKAEGAGFGLDGTIGLPIVDIGGVIRLRPSSDDVAAIRRAPPSAPSASLRQFRSAVGRLHAVNRVALAARTFNPAILPGVSSSEDEEALRAMMSEMVAFDDASRHEWEDAHAALDQEKADQARRSDAQLAHRTDRAAKKLHGVEGAPAAAASTVSAVVRWTNRAAIAHKKAVAEEEAAEAAAAPAESEGAAGEVILYGRDACGWCSHVADDFTANGITFRKVDIDAESGCSEMWEKVRSCPEIGNNVGLPVVDICGKVTIRPTAADVLAIRKNPPRPVSAAAAAEGEGGGSCDGDDCSIISHETGSREGGKPPLLSLEGALALSPPVSNFYGADGPQDEKLTIYGAFSERKCKLYCPTRGPIVTGVPFQLCLVTSTDVEEVGVLADGEFPVVASLQPLKVEDGKHVFFGEMLITAEASELTFYSVSHGEGGCSSLEGLFEWTGCITRSTQLAGSSSKESELKQAAAKAASGDLEGAVAHLDTALVYDSADAAVLVQRAELQLQRRVYDKAVADGTLALASDEGMLEAWKVVAEAEFARGHYNACIELCRKAPGDSLKDLSAQVEAAVQAQAPSHLVNAERWAACDERARGCPEDPAIVGSLESLARYLTEPFETDLEKHRVIFVWVADHISYNGKALQTGNYEVIQGVDPFSPEGVLQARTGVCSAYSRLYKGLTDVVGIETICCAGYTYMEKKSKSKETNPKSSHEWNCIKIDGVWTPCDSTWAAGSVGGDYKFSKRFDEFWWMTPPSQFIYTHLPEDTQWACLPEGEAVPSVKEFQLMPDLKGNFFSSGLELVSHKTNTVILEKNTEVTLKETGERRFVMANLDGKNLVTKYDQTSRTHTILLEGKGKGNVQTDSEVRKELCLFWSKEEYGTYAGLLEYHVKRKSLRVS